MIWAPDWGSTKLGLRPHQALLHALASRARVVAGVARKGGTSHSRRPWQLKNGPLGMHESINIIRMPGDSIGSYLGFYSTCRRLFLDSPGPLSVSGIASLAVHSTGSGGILWLPSTNVKL